MTSPPSLAGLRGLLRLGLAPFVFSVAGGLLAGLVLGRVLDGAIEGRTEASALALLARVGPDLEDVLGSGRDQKEAVDRLGRQLSLRATLVAPDGRVLADSAVEPARLGSLENHAARPEIVEARRSGTGVETRFSATLGERLVYAAARLRNGAVLRLAFPERELAEWEAPFRRRTVGLSVLAGLLVALLLVAQRLRHASELDFLRGAVAAAENGERRAGPRSLSDGGAAVASSLGDLADAVAARAEEARHDAAVARTVFEEAPAGLLVVDAGLSLLEANPEALRLLGAGPGALRRGEHVLEFVREKAVADLVAAALRDGRRDGRITLSAEHGGRTLEAAAVRVGNGARPGRASVVALLRETPSR